MHLRGYLHNSGPSLGPSTYLLYFGASINYVDKQQEGEGVSQMSIILCTFEQWGKGVKNPQNLVNLVYECPLVHILFT